MSRRTRLVRTAVAAALAVAAAPVSSSSAADRAVFTWSATGCREVLVGLPLSTSKLQELLPDGYTVVEEAPGTGALQLGMAECATLRVAGVEQPRDSSADAVIPARDRAGATVKYHLWQVTGAPALRQRMQELGVRGGLSPTAAARSTTTAVVASGTADVPWSFAPHSVAATGASVLPPASGTASWVQVTPKGTVETRFSFTDYQMHLGGGRVTAPEGSWLAKLMGSTTHEGLGVLSEPFDFTAQVRLRTP